MIWSSNLTIGVKSIDDEHRNLVKMITRLENSLKDGLITEQTGFVIKDVVDYTQHHFKNEELYMEQISFPELERHKILHVDLVNAVIAILKDLRAGKPFTSVDLIKFLQKWLKNHIIDEDMKIGDFAKNLIFTTKKES